MHSVAAAIACGLDLDASADGRMEEMQHRQSTTIVHGLDLYASANGGLGCEDGDTVTSPDGGEAQSRHQRSRDENS